MESGAGKARLYKATDDHFFQTVNVSTYLKYNFLINKFAMKTIYFVGTISFFLSFFFLLMRHGPVEY